MPRQSVLNLIDAQLSPRLSRYSHRPEEKTRVQSLNDFIVFGMMAVGSFSSGGLLSAYGWNTVLWVSFAPLAISALALAAAMARNNARVASSR